MFCQTPVKTIALVAILACLALYAVTGSYYGRELVVEVAVLAILAISLDMVAGYGGMISLCHGSIFGLGAYAYASVNVLMGGPPALALAAAVAVSAAFGFAVGAVTSRTRGIFFIMATLAFGQMVYVLIFDSKTLGGDDGMWGIARLDFSVIGVDLHNPMQFALFALFCFAAAYSLAAMVLRSAFGRTLSGIHENEDRMRALGISVWKFKAVAFGLSGALAGLSGSLAAQQTMFVSPELIVWTVSGEALIVVILGGLGTLVGPLVGATLLVFLKHEISSITTYWHMVIGLVLIVTVMAGGRGIYGGLEAYLKKRASQAALKSGAGTDA
jgi:branched-chain amino acid transport system permease protein